MARWFLWALWMVSAVVSAFGSFRSGRLEENSVAAFRFNGRFTERIGGGIQYASSAFLDAEKSLRRGDLAINYGSRW